VPGAWLTGNLRVLARLDLDHLPAKPGDDQFGGGDLLG
jgi:hypothetical protein